MAITTFKRYEMKYILPTPVFNSLLPVLTEHMEADSHCRDKTRYPICNIYYDTRDNSIIRHSLSKPYYKEKLRLRSYDVPASATEPVFLELKKKIGGIVSKRRAVLPLQEAVTFVENNRRPSPADYMNEQVINEIQFFLNQHEVYPTTYISYQRMALFGKEDKDFRITFDSDIVSRRYDLDLGMGIYGDPLLKEGQYLMEVKIPGAVPLWLARVFSDLKIFKTRFSKYGREYEKARLNSPQAVS